MERKSWSADLFSQSLKAISENDVLVHRKWVQQSSLENFDTNSFNIEHHFNDKLDMKNVSLSISVEKLQYDNMSEFVDANLQQALQNVQLKKDNSSVEKLLEQLEKPELSGNQSFWNWLELLKNFLQKQYPDEYDEYEKLLQEMKIL